MNLRPIGCAGEDRRAMISALVNEPLAMAGRVPGNCAKVVPRIKARRG